MIGLPRALVGRGRAHCGALVLAAFCLLPAAPVGAQVSVEELEVHLTELPSREPLTRSFSVRNDLDRAQQVRVSIRDWRRDTLGRNEFLDVGAVSGSCREGLTVFPATFQIAPKGVEFVRVSYQPDAARDGCWSIVILETVQPPPADRPQGSFLTIELRTGVKVYVHPASAIRQGTIAFADVVQAWEQRSAADQRPDSSLVWQADLRFVSAGNEHLTLRSSVEIRNLEGELVHRVRGVDALLTPGGVRDLRLTLPAMAKGEYVALLMVDYGGDEIAAAQVEFTVP